MPEITVGVIGGMGPDATVELMQRVIQGTPATDDADHIHMLVDNNPKIPSRIQHLLEGHGKNPGPTIAAMAKRLAQAGAGFLVIPCNTAHHYHHYAQDAVSIPVWHMIELSLDSIADTSPQCRKIGLLASSAVQKINLFEPFFAARGLELIYPDHQTQTTVMDLIRSVKAGTATQEKIQLYNQQITTLTDRGAESLLIGCSELSVLHDEHQQKLPLIDSLQVLADCIIRACIDD